MPKTTGHFVNKRGNKLYTVSWTPDAGEVKAVLFWHHGFGEYIDRIDAVAKIWAAAGIAVYGFDAHGMGLSEPLDEPNRSLIRKFSNLVDDALQFFTETVQPAAAAQPTKTPVFMGGNSLGGLIAAYVVLAKQDDFAGLILQSPALDVEWTPVLRMQAAMGNMLATLVPRAKLVPAVRPEDMSQDPEVVKEYLADPMIYQGNVKAQSGNEILKGFRGLQRFYKDFKLPILGVHGTCDRCTSLPALRMFLKRVSSSDVTLKEVEGGYHELLHGPEKEQVRTDISDWILAHATAPAPAAAAGTAAGGEKAEAPETEAPAETAEAAPAQAATPASPEAAP